jgi:hypothetical protein
MAFGGSLVVTGLAIWHLSRLAKRLDAGQLVFCGRLSAFSSATMFAIIVGVVSLLNHLVVRDSLVAWLGMTLYAILYLWPAAYELIWRYRVGRARCQ